MKTDSAYVNPKLTTKILCMFASLHGEHPYQFSLVKTQKHQFSVVDTINLRGVSTKLN